MSIVSLLYITRKPLEQQPTQRSNTGTIQNLGGQIYRTCYDAARADTKRRNIFTVARASSYRTTKYLFAISNMLSGGSPIHADWLETLRDLKTNPTRTKIMESMKPFRLPRGFCAQTKLFEFVSEKISTRKTRPFEGLKLRVDAPTVAVFQEVCVVLQMAGASTVVSATTSKPNSRHVNIVLRPHRIHKSIKRGVIVSYDWVVACLVKWKKVSYREFVLGKSHSNENLNLISSHLCDRFPCSEGEFLEMESSDSKNKKGFKVGKVLELLHEDENGDRKKCSTTEIATHVRWRVARRTRNNTTNAIYIPARGGKVLISSAKYARNRAMVLSEEQGNKRQELSQCSGIYVAHDVDD